MPNKKCNPVCAPFVIYIILSVISLLGTIFNNSTTGASKVFTVGLSVLGMTLFGALYYWLCSICKKTTAWVILLLPVIIYTLIFIVMVGVLASSFVKNEVDKNTN
jgi:hypothetical protein